VKGGVRSPPLRGSTGLAGLFRGLFPLALTSIIRSKTTSSSRAAFRRRGAFWGALVFGLSFAFSLGACGNGSRAGAKSAGAVTEGGGLIGAPAPDFSLTPQGGGAAIGPGALKGQVVIVDFWATWCAPCRNSFPAYQALVDEFGGKLAVIGVSVDDDSSGIEKFRSETGVKFPLVWDDGQAVAESYRPGTMPTSFVVDKAGIVAAIHEGFHEGDEAILREKIRSLL
jgi:cytochrome c biogenesis protein CcmG/thiol:disulfide interchange protein DsbE